MIPIRSLWRCAAIVAALALGLASAGRAEALREQPPVPPRPLEPQAAIRSSRWIELILPEHPYDDKVVADPKRYRVTSADDNAYAAGVEPLLVHHRHWPENAWYRSSGNNADNIAAINVVYRIFLQLPKDLLEGKRYTVKVDAAVAKVPPLTADGKQSNDIIHINQVGYRPGDEKVGYLSCWTGQGSIEFAPRSPFTLVDASSGDVVFTGEIRLEALAKDEPWSGSNVYELDFSKFNAPGRYRVHVPGAGLSFPFRIDGKVYADIAYTMVRGLTMERDGDAGLTPAVTHWPRPPAHMDDAIDEKSGVRVDLTGGHMDAGDRGKYPHDSADTAAALLSAIELYPKQVEALGETLQIRESHNGIPDLIDETLVELDWLAKAVMGSSTDGTLPLYLRPAGGGYEMGAPPEGLKGRVMFNQKMGPARSETLYAAGALAWAANNALFKKYVPKRCALFQQAAERAFAGFEKHNGDEAYWKDIGTYDSDAQPHKWSDELLLAAIQLLELTGKPSYAEWVHAQLPADFKANKQWTWKVDMPYLVVWLSLSRAKSPLLEDALKKRALDAVFDWAESTMQHDRHLYATPFGAPLPWMINHRVGWYFTGSANAWPLMIAYGVSGEERFKKQLVRDWNWLLGTNPLSRSFVSGLGDPEHRPRWLVHEIAQVEWSRYKSGDATGWSEIPPGLISADVQGGHYGWYLNDAHNKQRREAKFPGDKETPPLYLYHDSWNVEDEMTIDRLARTVASALAFIESP